MIEIATELQAWWIIQLNMDNTDIKSAKAAYDSGNYAAALKAFEQLAKQGDLEAQNKLAEMYQFGRGTRKNYAEAAKWLRKAAEQGDGNAQYDLGELYKEGKGVKRDGDEALKWFLKAAEKLPENVHNPVEYAIGRMYLDGDGIQQDYVKAMKWLRQAAECLTDDSIYLVGEMYRDGLGVQPDDREAAKWFCKGADLEDIDCIEALAKLYKKGVHIREDDCPTVKLFKKAEEEGDLALQLQLRLREPSYGDYFNKHFIFIIGGILSMLFFAWYDWIMITEVVTGPEPKVKWFTVVLVGLVGIFIGRKMGGVTYQIDAYARVSGVPFPVVLYEPRKIGSDDWISFEGVFTILSPLLNAAYFSLALIAILLTVSRYL